MIAVIDNYDSFTYNLVQYLLELGARVRVFRNDEITCQGLEAMSPDRILISPGPGTPENAGISNEVVLRFGMLTPVLGVCLGHQCIAESFGGTVERADRLMHGKTSSVHHLGGPLYDGIPSPFTAARYHSLIVRDPLPNDLAVTASSREGEVMGLAHRTWPVHGVQFHPESILTAVGKKIIRSFLNL